MLSDLGIVREATTFQLGKDQLPIDADFKPAAIGWHEDEPFDARFEFLDELLGQTDRLWFVVSGLAIDDFDFHKFLFFIWRSAL